MRPLFEAASSPDVSAQFFRKDPFTKMTTIHFLGSVFLPAKIFDRVSSSLRSKGHDVQVTVPNITHGVEPIDEYKRALSEARSNVVVAHSNAGLFVPQLVREKLIGSAIFMDSALPADNERVIPMATHEQRQNLCALASGPYLPKWTEWWTGEEKDRLFPDDTTMRQIQSETPRVPVAFLDRRLNNYPGWTDKIKASYMSFGKQYENDRIRAEQLGWPTVTLDVGHLGSIRNPHQVASVLDLLCRLQI